jgi:hypothetical protein
MALRAWLRVKEGVNAKSKKLPRMCIDLSESPASVFNDLQGVLLERVSISHPSARECSGGPAIWLPKARERRGACEGALAGARHTSGSTEFARPEKVNSFCLQLNSRHMAS